MTIILSNVFITAVVISACAWCIWNDLGGKKFSALPSRGIFVRLFSIVYNLAISAWFIFSLWMYTNLFVFSLLAYAVLDEIQLAIRRIQSRSRETAVSIWRLSSRLAMAAAIVCLWLFDDKRTLYQGAFVGYITNVFVTLFVLHIAIPFLQNNIAAAARTSFGALIDDADTSSDNGGRVVRFFKWVFRDQIAEETAAAKHKAKVSMEQSIKNMTREQICDLMDGLVGRIFIVMEIAGLVAGVAIAALL